MKCKICGKPIKENTDGNRRYCQGHDLWEVERRTKKRACREEEDLETDEPEWLIDNPDEVWTW